MLRNCPLLQTFQKLFILKCFVILFDQMCLSGGGIKSEHIWNLVENVNFTQLQRFKSYVDKNTWE